MSLNYSALNMITQFEEKVRSCFPNDGVQNLWFENDKMYVAIPEDHNWWKNKCVLQDWFFNYKQFETLPLSIDCQSYGVYVIWEKKKSE